MLCKKCGAQIDDNANVCIFCGETFAEKEQIAEENYEPETTGEAEVVEETEAVEEVAAVAEDTRSTHEIFEENERKRKEQMEQKEEVVDEKEQQLSQINERRELKKKKERRKKIALVVILCLLVAALAGGGAFYLKYYGNTGGNVIKTTPTPIPTPKASYTPTPTPSEAPEATETAAPTQAAPSGPVKVTTTTTPITKPTAAPKKTPVPTAAPVKAPAQSSTAASRKGTNADTYKVPQKQSGVVDSALVAKLVVGGEVIDDGTTKLPVMTFNLDGTTYYAYVSEGSWTGAVNGKYMTVSATATGEKYKGNTIYDISRLVYYTADDYVIADSGVRELSAAELQNYSKDQLALARNEIFARHGRKFDTKEFSDHFANKSWYKVSDKYNYSDESSNINSIEKKNVDTILAVELTK